MLTELMVAMVVFGIIATGLASMSLSLIKTNGSSKSHEVAAGLANKDLDVARAIGPAGLTLNRTVLPPATVGGITYTMFRDVAPYAPGVTGCGVGVETSRRVTTTVEWPAMPGRPVSATTVLTATPGTFAEGKGNVGVSLVDQDNQPLAGIPVTLASGSLAGAGTVSTTTDEGCAAFTGLTPGTFTSWLGNSPTWVVPGYMHGTTPVPAKMTQSVTAGNVSTWSAQYGKAGSLNMTVDTDDEHPVPANVPFTIYNTSFPNTGSVYATKYVAAASQQFTSSSSSLTARSFPYLFPSASGYVPWLGDCSDADPGVTSGLRGTVVAMPPGGTATGTAKAVKIDLVVDNLTPGASMTITATHLDGANGCSTSTVPSYKIAPSNIASTATGADQTIGFALPYGGWRFTASSNGRTGTTDVTFTGAETGTATQTVNLELA